MECHKIQWDDPCKVWPMCPINGSYLLSLDIHKCPYTWHMVGRNCFWHHLCSFVPPSNHFSWLMPFFSFFYSCPFKIWAVRELSRNDTFLFFSFLIGLSVTKKSELFCVKSPILLEPHFLWKVSCHRIIPIKTILLHAEIKMELCQPLSHWLS